MKRTLVFTSFLFSFILSFGQGYSISDFDSNNVKLSQTDRLIVSVFSDVWQNIPSNVNAKSINVGASTTIYKDMPINLSNFSFAFGLGITSHNFHSDAMPSLNSTGDTLSLTNIPDSVNGSLITYSKNKFSLSYLDLPIEFRFRSKSPGNKKMKYSLGFKIGYLINRKIKYKGRDLNGEDKDVKYKSHNIQFVENFRYGVTARIGWSWIAINAYYSLTPIFIKDKGPDMFPISAGISLSPFN
jgi:hypothetical protein